MERYGTLWQPVVLFVPKCSLALIHVSDLEWSAPVPFIFNRWCWPLYERCPLNSTLTPKIKASYSGHRERTSQSWPFWDLLQKSWIGSLPSRSRTVGVKVTQGQGYLKHLEWYKKWGCICSCKRPWPWTTLTLNWPWPWNDLDPETRYKIIWPQSMFTQRLVQAWLLKKFRNISEFSKRDFDKKCNQNSWKFSCLSWNMEKLLGVSD